MVAGWVMGVLRMAGKRSGADASGQPDRAPPVARLHARGLGARNAERASRLMERPSSGGFTSGVRQSRAAGQAADADPVEPDAGPGRGVVVTKLLAQLHPEASEDVPALVAVGDGPRAPPGVAGRDLDDGPVAGRGQHRVDFGLVGLALHAQHPAHDGDALGVPGGVDAEARRASDRRRRPRRGRLGDALLDIRPGSELGGLVDCLGREEGPGAGRRLAWRGAGSC